MNLFKRIAFLCISISISSFTQANVGIVAEPGMPAPGFPPGFTYWNVTQGGTTFFPVIGRNGHIAFSGAADISGAGGGSTSSNTNAVWTGYPGQLRAVIKQGDVPLGFPPNFVFAGGGSLIVTGSGMVVMTATLSGPIASKGLIVDINGSPLGIIKTGDPAPGFPVGTILTSFLFNSVIASDAGVVFTSFTNTGGVGIWFWDSQLKTIQLVASSSGDASAAYPGCNYGVMGATSINDSGDIAFNTNLIGSGCPRYAIVRWNRGALSPVVSSNDLVPGFPADVQHVSSFDLTQINDTGDVVFRSILKRPAKASKDSFWVARKNGPTELVVMVGEVKSDDPNALITGFLPFVHTNASGKTVVSTITSNFVLSILTGLPKTSFSYPDLVNVGTSHLNAIINNTDTPPGFGNTWFYDTLEGPLINNQGQIALTAIVKDSLNPFSSATVGIWKGGDASSLQLVAKQGMTIKVNGADETLTTIRKINGAQFGGSTNGGRASQLSDSGQIIFIGGRMGLSFGALGSIFITPSLKQDDIIVDFGSIGLWARMNDSSWQKLNNSSPDDVITGDVDGNGVDDVIADFGSTFGGLFIKRNGGGWSKLHNSSPQSMATGDLDGNGKDDIVIDFGGIGLWARMNDSSWIKLNNSSPDQFVITDMDGNGADDVIADFGSTFGGLYVKRNLGGWSKMHNTSPVTMATGDIDGNGSGDVIINFGGIGLWARMNNASWTKLHNGSPDSIVSGDVDGNGADDVIASFGSTTGGVWQKLNLGGWSKLNNNAPDQMVMGDVDANGQSDLIAAFNSTLGGIFVRRNNGNWQKLHNSNPDDLAVGELDGS